MATAVLEKLLLHLADFIENFDSKPKICLVVHLWSNLSTEFH